MAHQRRTNATAAHVNAGFTSDGGGGVLDSSERPPAIRMMNLTVPVENRTGLERNKGNTYYENEAYSRDSIGCATDDNPFDNGIKNAIAKTRPVTEADIPNPTGNSTLAKTPAEDLPMPDPHDDELDSSTTGHFLTVMNMIKANVGTGILAMPLAFSHSGLVMGVVYTFMLGVICVDCMHMVVRASHHFKRVLQRSQLSYPEVAMLAFRHSPLRRGANAMRVSVVIFLTITQLGVCCVYIVFVSRTIENVLHDYHKVFNVRLLELISAPAFLLLVMVRQMKRLAGLMMLANIITIAALICVWQEVVRHLQPFSSLPQIGGLADFARFFSTAVYAFEGIGCVLPVENKMTRPETFGGLFGVLNQAMVVVALLYATTGFFGFWGFGYGVQGSITYSLPAHPVYVAVKIGMAVAVFFSYGLQFYVPIKMAALSVRMRWKNASNIRMLVAEYGMRVGLMLLTLMLALFIPYLGLFIDLIGAFGGSYLALILPPVIDIVYRLDMKVVDGAGNLASVPRRRYGRFHWILIKDVAFLLFGLAGFGLGTYLAVHDIVVQFIKDAGSGASTGAGPASSGNQTAITH